MLTTYQSLNQSIDNFFENVGNALNIYNQKYDTFLLCGNFNSEHSEPSLSVSYGKYLL